MGSGTAWAVTTAIDTDVFVALWDRDPVVAGLAAEFLVVDFEIRHRAAHLASPAIPPQYLLRSCSYKSGSSCAGEAIQC